LDWPGAVGHWLGWVGDVFVKGAVFRFGRGEAELETGREVERLRLDFTTAGAAGRPGGKTPPEVGSRIKGVDGRGFLLGGLVFQILVEEGAKDLLL